MLKRSFAEFHAQRAAPEALEALQKGQERLAQLRARPWPHSFQGTSRQEVEEYHSVGRRIEKLSGELQVGLHISITCHHVTFLLSFTAQVSAHIPSSHMQKAGRHLSGLCK